MVVINSTVLFPRTRAIVSHFQSSLMFPSLPKWSTLQHSTLRTRLLALPENIRLGWKWQTIANTQAYNGMKFRLSEKSFMVQ